MTSTVVSNSVISPDRSSSSRESRKKRRRKNQQLNQSRSESGLRDAKADNSAWKTETQQRIYSSKLLQALRHVRATTRRGQAVRQAADRVLAATAKGKTRWSRALLKNRLKVGFMKRKRHVAERTNTSIRATRKSRGVSVSSGAVKLRRKSMPAVQKKTRVLGRLVPGCKKQSLPVILEEATDYIAALEMQVRAMSALAQLLSGNPLQPN